MDLFGVPVDVLTLDATVRRCCGLVEARRAARHVVLNASKVVQMANDSGLRDVICTADVVSADGMSVVWAGRWLGVPLPERVTGIEVMGRLLAEAERKHWPTYFLGARSDALAACLEAVLARHPHLRVAGAHHGYFDDDDAIADEIRASGARLLFVAMPSPRKERFVASRLSRMGGLLAVGVGGAFDVWAGRTRRAPRWMQRTGLEWLFRMIQEPRRMAGRYLVGNTRFLWIVLQSRMRSSAMRSRSC